MKMLMKNFNKVDMRKYSQTLKLSLKTNGFKINKNVRNLQIIVVTQETLGTKHHAQSEQEPVLVGFDVPM